MGSNYEKVLVAQVNTPWYTKLNTRIFGRESSSGTGELFYRALPGLNKSIEYDHYKKSNGFYPMLRDYCTPSSWPDIFQVFSLFIVLTESSLLNNILMKLNQFKFQS